MDKTTVLPFSQSLKETNSSKQCVSVRLNPRMAWFKNSLERIIFYTDVCYEISVAAQNVYERELVYLQVLQVLPVYTPPFLGVAYSCDRWLSCIIQPKNYLQFGL